MEMIPADNHVDGCVHLNAADFCACQILFVVDMMDVVILNNREHAS